MAPDAPTTGYPYELPVELTRAFLADPGRSLRHLFG